MLSAKGNLGFAGIAAGLLISVAVGAKPPKTVKPAANALPKAAPTWWAFRPITPPAVPKVKQANWVRSPLDAFVLAKLEAKGLSPNPAADRRTLIRRVTFDLTGLPPTPEETETFVTDTAPNAYEKVVERLLASSAYGERWGRHWLDLVRYTDSLDKRDTDTIRDINDAWRYRDWIVNALNRDMPYDRFIQNQIAGDLLPGEIPNEINKAGTIATGLLAIGNWGNGDGDKRKALANIADDQIDVISRGVMGLTIACARCHDHKFDPISTQDYYALAGIFYSTRILPRFQPTDAMETPLKIPLLTRSERKQRETYAADLLKAEDALEAVSAQPLTDFARRMLLQTARYVFATWAFRNRSEDQAGMSLAEFAKAQNLEPELIKQWRDYFAEGDYIRLDVPVRDLEEVASVHVWKGKTETPYVLYNTNPVARKFGTVEIPRIMTAVHPGKNGVVVGWKSPITGTIKVTGAVKSADTSGGDGIEWRLDYRTVSGYRTFAGGEIENGSEAQFLHPQTGQPQISLNVKRGDSIQLVVLPKENPEHDATLVRFHITDTRGSEWDMILDCVENVLMKGKGNPHPDKYGNPDVWHFLDATHSHRNNEEEEAFETAREAWQTAGSSNRAEDADKVKQAANAFGRTFQVTDSGSPFRLKNRDSWRLLPDTERTQLEQAANRVEKLLASAPPPIVYANGVQEGGIPNGAYPGFQDVRVHLRGNPEKLGERVPRRFPATLTNGASPRIKTGSGRLELARWLTVPTHPLTARVIVNRLWQHHFGEGIVRTPSNFGKLGERPTHPELLDYLASELVRQKWSLKRIHKLILMSATYRQSSIEAEKSRQLDPDNRLLSHQNRRRLEAEAVRDILLSAAGTLDVTQGGKAIDDTSSHRRALYLMTIRSGDDPFRAIFDGADPAACVDKRVQTVVAPQALYWLNNQFVWERAQETATRILNSVSGDSARIQFAYSLLFGREPSEAETAVGLKFLTDAKGSNREIEAWREYTHLLLCTNEFVTVD